jgi:hypothetical protein
MSEKGAGRKPQAKIDMPERKNIESTILCNGHTISTKVIKVHLHGQKRHKLIKQTLFFTKPNS